ncbi:MAG: PDZ domain-containing protein [Deferribacterales bacterium]
MRKILFIIILLLYLMVLSGCGAAVAKYDLLSPQRNIPDLFPKDPASVVIVRENEKPELGIIRIANIGVHGNGYADRALLENKLIQQAAYLGADVVVIVGSEVTRDETVGIYNQGVFTSSQVQRPHLYGVAGVWSKVIIGIHFDSNGNIVYVKNASPAEKAGLKEGHKILAMDGKFFDPKSYMLDNLLAVKKPGDSLIIEYLDDQQIKRKVNVLLESFM